MARSPASNVRLAAIAAAKRLHRELGSEPLLQRTGGDVDVFAIIAALDIPLIFKPLSTALGLCLPKPLRGIMVTTRRSLHIQRFTAAHELAHVVLEHRASIDREILERGPFVPEQGRDPQEIAADAFAAEFLLPRWLYLQHIRRQQWSVAHLRNPAITYQLSLRLGASYQATCWGLLGHQILPRGDVDSLLATPVASLKREAGGDLRPGHGQADVWRFTERDHDGLASGNADDLITLRLAEHVSSGYEWDLAALTAAGFIIAHDQTDPGADDIAYGAPSTRTIALRLPAPARTRLAITERRLWLDADPGDRTLALTLAFEGAETGGLSRADRQRQGARAA